MQRPQESSCSLTPCPFGSFTEADWWEVRERLSVLARSYELLLSQVEREKADMLKVVERVHVDADKQSTVHAHFFDQKFDAFLANHVKNHEREHEVEQHASELAMRAMDQRLSGMNEFRAQIASTEARYATKADLKGVEDKIDAQGGALGDRLRATEAQLVDVRGRILGKDYAESVDTRFRGVERLVYMASGAITVIVILLQFIKH